MIQDKRARGKIVVNFAVEKARLVKMRDGALERGDVEAAAGCANPKY